MPINCSRKKHAVLIMAHNQFKILEKLMIQLDHERNDLYIHVDRKTVGLSRQDLNKYARKVKSCL